MSNEKPSIFKVLIEDPTDQLRLPPVFSRKYELSLPEFVKLTAHDGRKWKVKVEPLYDGVLGFTRGWKAFAEAAALQRGEFIVFTPLNESKFAVFIYDGSSFCEREFPPTTTTTTTPPPHRHRNMRSSKSNPLYFEFRLQPYHTSRITLPVAFSKAGGMQTKRSVMVEYAASGACEAVAVDHGQPQQRRVDLASGWAKFRKENGMKFGKHYSFHFIPNLKRILVHRLRVDA